MELKDTVQLMTSPDYKERFQAEYWQLKIRYDKLYNMLTKYKKGTLPFAPKCSYEILSNQAVLMRGYLNALEERARIEEVNLEEFK